MADLVQTDIVYNIYRTGLFSKDATITNANKALLYHVEFPMAFFGAWNVTFHCGEDKGAPIAMQISKPIFNWDFEITDHNIKFATKLAKAGLFTRKHIFHGPDGREYAWKGTGFGGDLKLIAYPEKAQIALYKRSNFAISKLGKIIVSLQAQQIANLIIATGFAVEEWEREQKRKRESERHTAETHAMDFYNQPLPTADYTYNIVRPDSGSKNAIITTVSNEKVYDVHFANTNEAGWVISFTVGNEPPQIAMQVQKPANKSDFDVTDYTANHRSLFVRPSGSNSHVFVGADRREYMWEEAPTGMAHFLVAQPERVQVAYFERSDDVVGKIIVTGQVLHMLSLIIATGFSIQEWALEEQQMLLQNFQMQQALTDHTYRIYRPNGNFRSAVITSNDQPVYNVDFSYLNESDWLITCKTLTNPPQIAMQVQKPAGRDDFDVTDYTANHRTLFVKTNPMVSNYSFTGPDNKEYGWEDGGGNVFLLVANPERVQIGYFERIGNSINNQGKFVVTGQALHMLNLILATGFAIQEVGLENLERQRVTAQYRGMYAIRKNNEEREKLKRQLRLRGYYI
ncbi:hypothetical protein HDV01_002936 [Terramyces sp. JEL0728]|nr:hypothetical protein HDV01_002936 [Terramyces sp. JEL0728]